MAEFPTPYREERKESPGEAQIRLAGNFIKFFMLFGVRFYPHEQEALGVAMAAFIRWWRRAAKEAEKP